MKSVIIATTLALSLTALSAQAENPRRGTVDKITGAVGAMAQASEAGANVVTAGADAAANVIDATGDRLSGEIRGRSANDIGELRVRNNITLNGQISAEDNANINIGDSSFHNVVADDIEINNTVNLDEVEADDSDINIAQQSLTNLEANTVYIETSVDSTSRIKAEDESTINIGTTSSY